MPNPWEHMRRTGVADDIDFAIKGEELQFVEIELDPGESAVAEAGAMVWKDAAIEMTTVFGDGSGQGAGGGLGPAGRVGEEGVGPIDGRDAVPGAGDLVGFLPRQVELDRRQDGGPFGPATADSQQGLERPAAV